MRRIGGCLSALGALPCSGGVALWALVVHEHLEIRLPFVKVRENEPFDIALRRFKRSCEKANILSEVRKREYYEKPTTVRKRKAAAAVKRHLKKLQREARRFERAF